VLTGIMLSATTVFIIERQLWRAALFAVVAAVLTSFGFMHGEHIGLGQSPGVAGSYLAVAAFLALCARFAGVTPREPEVVTHQVEPAASELATASAR